MQTMSGDNPTFYLDTSPSEGGNQTARSASEGSSEIEAPSFDANARLFSFSEQVPPSMTTPVPNRLKPGNKKSFVWNYFRHPENEAGIVDRTRTQCLLCKSQLAFNASGTTTTMLNHLKSRHGEVAQREESQRIRTGTTARRKENSTSRTTYSPLKAHQAPLQLPIPPSSQMLSSRMKHSDGCGVDYSKMSDDLRKFSDSKQSNQKRGLLQPLLGFTGFNNGYRQTMPSPESIAAEAAAAVGLLPPSMFLGGFQQLPTGGSSPFIPPLFSLPPPLESGSLMPQLTGLLPPNFPSFLPPSSSSSSEDSAEQIQPDSGPLAAAKAWLSTLPGLSGQNGNTNGNRMSNSLPNNSAPPNFAAMEDFLKSLPDMSGQQQGEGSAKRPLFPPMPPELLSTLVHNNPLVMSLLSRSQALLASQGCVPPPSMPQPGSPSHNSSTNFSLPVTSTTSSNIKPVVNNSDVSIGTAKRKRTRPVYIPPQMTPVKRPPVKDGPNAMEIPEDLSVHRGAEEPKQEQEEIKEKERTSRTEPLEKRLAYFLIQEMLPSEIIEGEGFKTLVTELIGPNASAIPRITARRMRMEILPQIASTVVPSSQDVNRNILAVEFWHSIPGRQNFANLTLGCCDRLLQTAILKSPTDSKRIIIDNFGGEESATVLPKVLVTNRPEEMKELLPKECIIIPCFITALATAVTNGFRRPETIALLRDWRESLGVCQNGASSLNDFALEAITWREVSDLLAQTRSEQGQDEISQLRSILESFGKCLDFIQQQESSSRTASLIAPINIDLRKTHLSTSSEDSGVIKAFKTTVIECLDGFYSSLNTLLIAGLIDPRVRAQILEAAPHSVQLLKEKVEELSHLRIKEEMFSHTANYEVDRYLKEEVTCEGQKNPLKWWSDQQFTYPLLSRLAKHYLNIPLASFNTQLRLRPLRKSHEKGILANPTLPDGLNFPNYCDVFAQLKMNLSTEDMLIYTFLWHNWHLSSNQ
ncbi:unnamed protein product [Hymenolepis diminuta]|uniref:BED-type domain-containing protein n=3 Tax=Hymenolepis diminuta TaxID=6216 RepID=A0A158QC93_HYMDI|nr:unnamed protein product [Hymenolepis diminuta]